LDLSHPFILSNNFSAWAGSTALAVVLLSVVFGVRHRYVGLRPAMIFHAWANKFGMAIVRPSSKACHSRESSMGCKRKDEQQFSGLD
jgi:hypothetical protein